ncbi:ATP-binding cassette domain-containing protein [Vibrio sp. SCSIO 43136]|uniref:metal ABC transporter ATP-binding protein n=1 Tax=Vibrio sp. SCSIO 43136 TaxID=2819101 RepID=UPI002076361A|nr:ATP-binding cassette domain-containing protein [Vibrio sp. SCSIO 43136]USD67274.1 ATP-binding cassette domain-containing protein [Vibrio sp. SCSIO 43136]
MSNTHLISQKIAGPKICFEGITLNEGPVQILHEINCTFSSGGWHAVLGPNGGGKSTLLKTILGMTNHRGKLSIHWPLSPTPKHKTFGYVPQLSPFDASLPISVHDYLLMTLTTVPVWFKRNLATDVIDALREVQLEDKLKRKLGELSGGERQRLMLCTALLKKPSLLLLDEPMTGLDKQGREDCLHLLKMFHQAGGTILMVEHDWEVVEKYCQQIFWVDKTILSVSSTEAFFRNQSLRHNAHFPSQITLPT